jgi:DNA-binding MurR/RpiR family transcriptional regulator
MRIKDNFDDFNVSERRIANYVMAYPDSILNMSIARLADISDSSQAGIVRFCKKLGFDGLKDIKSALARELIRSSPPKTGNEYSDIKLSDRYCDIANKVVINHVRALEETLKVIDLDAFQKAVDVLSSSKRVDIFGFGASGLVAKDMQQKFIRIGKYCLAYADIHLQLTAASSLTEHDAAVFISYSGTTKDIISCLHLTRSLGVKTIAITKYGSGRLGKMADIVLNVCSPEITVRSGAMSSRITQLAIIDMLFISVAGKQYDQSQELLRRSFESVQDRKYGRNTGTDNRRKHNEYT